MFFWCGRGALGNACAFSSAQHVGSTPPHVFREDRWSFVSNVRFWVTSSHAFLFIFPQCRYVNKSVSALRLRFLTSVHPFLMTASPALRVAGDAGAHPNCLWVKSPISHHSPSHSIPQPSYIPRFASLACFGHAERTYSTNSTQKGTRPELNPQPPFCTNE